MQWLCLLAAATFVVETFGVEPGKVSLEVSPEAEMEVLPAGNRTWAIQVLEGLASQINPDNQRTLDAALIDDFLKAEPILEEMAKEHAGELDSHWGEVAKLLNVGDWKQLVGEDSQETVVKLWVSCAELVKARGEDISTLSSDVITGLGRLVLRTLSGDGTERCRTAAAEATAAALTPKKAANTELVRGLNLTLAAYMDDPGKVDGIAVSPTLPEVVARALAKVASPGVAPMVSETMKRCFLAPALPLSVRGSCAKACGALGYQETLYLTKGLEAFLDATTPPKLDSDSFGPDVRGFHAAIAEGLCQGGPAVHQAHSGGFKPRDVVIVHAPLDFQRPPRKAIVIEDKKDFRYEVRFPDDNSTELVASRRVTGDVDIEGLGATVVKYLKFTSILRDDENLKAPRASLCRALAAVFEHTGNAEILEALEDECGDASDLEKEVERGGDDKPADPHSGAARWVLGAALALGLLPPLAQV